jgi:hypothetical protein
VEYTTEFLEALYHMGLTNIVWHVPTQEIVASFWHEEDATDYMLNAAPGDALARVVAYGPGIHIEFNNHG